MKEKKFINNTLDFLLVVILYYIVGTKNIITYVLSLTLYNIFNSYFNNLQFKDELDKMKERSNKYKFLIISIIYIITISLLFILLSILVSDISSVILKTNDMFIPFLFMGLSLMSNPINNLLLDYLESTKRKRKYKIINKIYIYNYSCLFVALSIIFFRIFKIRNDIAIALLFVPKIISLIFTTTITFIIIKRDNRPCTIKYNYRLALKKSITKNYNNMLIDIIKNSYYYISIIILYYILNTRYGYLRITIEEDLSFIFLYYLSLINYLIFIYHDCIKKNIEEKNLPVNIYNVLREIVPLVIILSFISPLVSKVIFNNNTKYMYLVMLNFLSIFIIIFKITSNNIKNKKILTMNLTIGIMAKIFLNVPLIDAFFRMGYNLIYGDILSTMIGLFTSIIMNYISSNDKNTTANIMANHILNLFYFNILLAIVLIILEFIVPIKTDSYLKSLLYIILYLGVGLGTIKVKNKLRNERG